MSDYVVTMGRSPGLTDEEYRARLARVYRLLSEIGQRARAADQESFESETQSAAGAAPTEGARGGAEHG